MTVRELIAKLEDYPDDATVGVRAACCGHSHGICKVDEAVDPDDWDDHHDVILNARE